MKHPIVYNVVCIIYLQNLEDNIELTKIKIERAEKLISGLGGEKDRWTQVGIIIFEFWKASGLIYLQKVTLDTTILHFYPCHPTFPALN